MARRRAARHRIIALIGLSACMTAQVARTEEGRPLTTQLPPPRPASLTPTAPTPQPVAPEVPAPTAGPEEPSCLRALAGVPGHVIKPGLSAAQAPGCEVVEPVVIEALAVRTPAGPAQVKLLPPPTVSCDLARAVAGWVDTSLQQLVRGAFARELTGLRVGGGHECRRRNRQTQGLLSEHATGRALDIFSFELGGKGDAASVSVEKPNGLDQTRFLDAVRQSACGAFKTVLGPGSDAAHANHLHVDIQERRSASRFCQ